ncbi:uncharacterized protein [Nicotiana sylvestris]|uniref:uncharacterized protein n=1 Tax=Nicotiana sylvestris TaxID=4096 RepID=UPI00388C9EEB
MVEHDTVEREENLKVSSLPVEESSAKEKDMGHIYVESTMTAPGLDSIGNTLPTSEFTMGLQEQEAIENMLAIAAEGSVIEGGEVVPEMRPLSDEENADSEEEDYDNMALEEFESVLRRNRKEKKKRRLMKDGKVVNEKVVPPALVVNVDDEAEEEPGSLVRKSSKNLTVPKSKKESSVNEKELRRVEGEKPGEKESEKVVEESCENVAEESTEKISRKSTDKLKSVTKSVKRKAEANE